MEGFTLGTEHLSLKTGFYFQIDLQNWRQNGGVTSRSREMKSKYPAGQRVSGKTCENERPTIRLDSNRPAT